MFSVTTNGHEWGKQRGETTDDADITDWGEHTRPRVLVSVPSPKRTLLLTTEHTKVTKRKFWSADAMGPNLHRLFSGDLR